MLGRRAAILVRMAAIAELNFRLACTCLACGLRRLTLRHGCRACCPSLSLRDCFVLVRSRAVTALGVSCDGPSGRLAK
jgi:hypothetical protein